MNKRSLLTTLLVPVLLLCGCAKKDSAPAVTTIAPIPTAAVSAAPATPAPTSAPSAEPTPAGKALSPEVQALTEENRKVWKEMYDRQWMEGRLVIPSVGIDVALFSWGVAPGGESDPDKDVEIVRQAVVDDPDSALLYYDNPVGNIIADHSTQDFSALANVKEGDAAYILSGERILSLRCDLVTDGTNTGYGITDKDGGWHHDEDYTCYTCMEDWTHVLLVGFTMTDEDFFDMNWIDMGGASAASSGSGAAASSGSSAATPAPGAVVTTVSMPASAAEVQAASIANANITPSPSPTPSAAPSPSAKPADAQQAAAPQNTQNNNNVVPDDFLPPSVDIYADNVYVPNNANPAANNNSGDGYLS